MSFSVQQSKDEYRIVGPEGETGSAAEYGDLAILKIDGAIYYADLEDEEEDPKIFCVKSIKVIEAKAEFVDFEPDEGQEEGGPVLVQGDTDDAPDVVA